MRPLSAAKARNDLSQLFTPTRLTRSSDWTKFKKQFWAAYRLGGPEGLLELMETRRELGLINFSRHAKHFLELRRLCIATFRETPPTPATGMSWEERHQQLVERARKELEIWRFRRQHPAGLRRA